MSHPLATELAEFAERLVGITNRRQLADLAAEIQALALRVNAALTPDQRVIMLEERVHLLERCFNFDHDEAGAILVVGTARFTEGASQLIIVIPDSAGILQVPFTPDPAAFATMVDGALGISIKVELH